MRTRETAADLPGAAAVCGATGSTRLKLARDRPLSVAKKGRSREMCTNLSGQADGAPCQWTICGDAGRARDVIVSVSRIGFSIYIFHLTEYVFALARTVTLVPGHNE